MSGDHKPLRYAHSEGHTDLCYTDDGRHILTCGSDGDIRIWEGLEDDDPVSQCVGEKAIAIAFHKKMFFVGTDNNNVQAYTFPGAEQDGIITRFTAPVTDICVGKSGQIVVSASCDMNIHVTNVETYEDKILTGHSAAVLGVALDPKEEFVISSSCDGSVRVWSVKDGSCIKTWNHLPKCSDFFLAKLLGRCSWQPNGRYFAIPSEKEVQVLQKTTWAKVLSFSDDEVKQGYIVTEFSPCGNYLAAASCNGRIIVWDINHQKCVHRMKHERGFAICSVAWNPNGKGEIAFCDVMGQLGTIDGCIPQEKTGSSVQNINEISPLEYPNSAAGVGDDDDDENAISLEKIKAEVGFHASDDFELDKILDDGTEKQSLAGAEDDDDAKASIVNEVEPAISLQAPFQPSSTPAHLQQYLMVWNSVGVVRCFNTEDENSIDVEFHDTSVHHTIHMNNYLNHTMATLSSEVLVLACEHQDDSPSKIVCVQLSSWDSSKEWSMELPDTEEVLAITTGRGWIAVGTDTRNLRLLTIGGTQREIVSVPGPMVCLAGQEEKLLLIFHMARGLPGDQNMGFCLITVGVSKIRSSSPQPLPLSPQSTLTWAGFSDEGSPCIVDSAGVVRNLSRQGCWFPVCDTSTHVKGKSDHYFVLGMSETQQNVRCVLCKGSYYPHVMPRPTVVEIPLQLPLCESGTEKTQLEDQLWRSHIKYNTMEVVCKQKPTYSFDKDEAEKILKEAVLKLFALACKSSCEYRAVELCEMMPSYHVVQLAMKYASKLGKIHLAEKLSDVATKKMEEQDKEEELSDYLCQAEYPKITYQHYGRENTSDVDEETEDVECTSSNQDEVNNENSNTLLALEKRKLSMEIKPALTPSQKKFNPFKKAHQESSSEKGLASFNKGPAPVKNIKPAVIETQPKARQKKVSKPQNENQKPSGKKNFMQWFEEEKPSLQEEFPELDAAELTKKAMRRYKELFAKKEEKNGPPADKKEAENTEESTKKRKTEDSVTKTDEKKPKISLSSSSSASKLKAFAFQKS